MVKKTKTTQQVTGPLPPEKLAPLVRLIRGERVLLDADLAMLYGVKTKALNQAVKRNRDRFPADFMFQLTAEEWHGLRSRGAGNSNAQPEAESPRGNRSQFVTGPARHRGAAARPYAFTEQGVAMLSSVLRSFRAVEVNIAIMRTFVQLRRLMDGNRLLAEKIHSMEKKYDEQFQVVFAAINQLIVEEDKPRRQIGFHAD
jgi:hypothetical protein